MSRIILFLMALLISCFSGGCAALKNAACHPATNAYLSAVPKPFGVATIEPAFKPADWYYRNTMRPYFETVICGYQSNVLEPYFDTVVKGYFNTVWGGYFDKVVEPYFEGLYHLFSKHPVLQNPIGWTVVGVPGVAIGLGTVGLSAVPLSGGVALTGVGVGLAGVEGGLYAGWAGIGAAGVVPATPGLVVLGADGLLYTAAVPPLLLETCVVRPVCIAPPCYVQASRWFWRYNLKDDYYYHAAMMPVQGAGCFLLGTGNWIYNCTSTEDTMTDLWLAIDQAAVAVAEERTLEPSKP